MKDLEAVEIIAILKLGSVAQEFSDERVAFWHKHVRTLPYQRTLDAVRRWAAAADPDGKPKFLSTPADVLTACNIPVRADVRDLVAEAVWHGGTVWPTVRGWERVPDDVAPDGYHHLVAFHAACTPQPESTGPKREVRSLIGGMMRALGGGQ